MRIYLNAFTQMLHRYLEQQSNLELPALSMAIWRPGDSVRQLLAIPPTLTAEVQLTDPSEIVLQQDHGVRAVPRLPELACEGIL